MTRLAPDVSSWLDAVELDHPCWTDYRDALTRLDGELFPGPARLNARLDGRARSSGSHLIRFVPSSALAQVDYETHIYQTGEVSTRENNWHDLFNALCWYKWPQLKGAMNRRHYLSMTGHAQAGRSSDRDVLTLFDECGAVLVSPSHSALNAVITHQWDRVFNGDAVQWNARYRIFITGHAMLEKFLQPYKAMTANMLLVKVSEKDFGMPRARQLAALDARLGHAVKHSGLLTQTRELSPLPLPGIPGWWQDSPQDNDFYRDRSVFRPAGKNAVGGQIIPLEL
ncbi:MAG: DUF3025 domain-containing protein [Gammaproteobacteria bacterium]|nr:DUF3025 domain-containing protein [Gammaproteobacteria bacterium]